WYHLAMSIDSVGVIRVYVNGGAIYETTYLADTPSTGTQIGANILGTEGFDGIVDEVRFWERTLCEAELESRVDCELPDTIAFTGLLAYYSFNQGVADSINTGLDSLIDLSGNENHGTLGSFALAGTSSNWTSGAPPNSPCMPFSPAVATVFQGSNQILH